jgi:hypothetical protein
MTINNLQQMSVILLRSMAAQHGVTRTSRLTRSELVAALSAKLSHNHGTAGHAQASTSRTRATGDDLFTSTVPPDLARSRTSTAAAVQPPMSIPQLSTPADPGLPIPTSYGRDRLVLMVQDPKHLFAYWELAGTALSRIRSDVGDVVTPVLVVHTPSGTEYRDIDIRGGTYYLAVAPGSHYRVDLALRDHQGQLHILMRSNSVTTPSPTISTRVDEQWMGLDETFHELLEMSGISGTIPSRSSGERLADRRREDRQWQIIHGDVVVNPLSSHVLSSRELVRTP